MVYLIGFFFYTTKNMSIAGVMEIGSVLLPIGRPRLS